jgi:hypothetical protein
MARKRGDMTRAGACTGERGARMAGRRHTWIRGRRAQVGREAQTTYKRVCTG